MKPSSGGEKHPFQKLMDNPWLLLALALGNRKALMSALELLTGELPLRSQADIVRMLLVGSAVSVAVIVTGIRMRQLQSLRDARVVAILCCVPMFSPLMFVGNTPMW